MGDERLATILSPISNQTPLKALRGVRARIWHLKTRLLIILGFFLEAVHVGIMNLPATDIRVS